MYVKVPLYIYYNKVFLNTVQLSLQYNKVFLSMQQLLASFALLYIAHKTIAAVAFTLKQQVSFLPLCYRPKQHLK